MGKHGTGYLYQKRGKGCWRVRWTSDGKLHDESTGTEDREKAVKIAAQKTACYSALGDVRTLTARLEQAKDKQGALEARTNPSLNLFRMVDAFKSCDVVRRRKNSDATLRSWVSHGNLLINEFGGTTEMRQLTRGQAETFMRSYEGKVSPSQFNNALAFFKRVWKTLKDYDSPTELKARLHAESPWAMIMPMAENEVVGKKPFTKEQLVRIWKVLEEINNPELTLLFDLARNTGARLHDLVSWKWDEHLKFDTTTINGEMKMEAVFTWKPLKTKNSAGKIITIPILDERVVKELYQRSKARKVGEEYITPTMLEMYNRNKACPLTHLCQKVFIKAGIQTKQKVEGNARANCVYGIHSFRHTLVSELFEKGVDLGTIQHLYTGHGSSYVTELYAHANMDKKRLDLSKLAPIETEVKSPDGFTTFIASLTDEDRKDYNDIELMDASPKVKRVLVQMLQFKNKEDLVAIGDWLNRRMNGQENTTTKHNISRCSIQRLFYFSHITQPYIVECARTRLESFLRRSNGQDDRWMAARTRNALEGL